MGVINPLLLISRCSSGALLHNKLRLESFRDGKGSENFYSNADLARCAIFLGSPEREREPSITAAAALQLILAFLNDQYHHLSAVNVVLCSPGNQFRKTEWLEHSKIRSNGLP